MQDRAGGEPTWREHWARTTAAVGDRTHARWLCETASGATGEEFLAALDDRPTDRMLAHLAAMVERSRAGEPLQYVLGHWGFRRLDLAIDRRALIPRPETELVAGTAIDLAAAAGPIRVVADLGTGSGAIGLALADELPLDGTTVWITDADADALEVARANLAGLGRAARNVRVALGDWCAALPDGVRFDVVVANPPYVSDGSADVEAVVTEWEPAQALFGGGDGLDHVRTVVRDAAAHVRPGGWLVLEIGADQGHAVAAMLRERGYEDVEVRPDLAGRDRVAVGRVAVAMVDDGDLRLRHMRNELHDYAHLLQWLRTPEVAEWYGGRDRDVDLGDVLAEYGPGGENERDGVVQAIVELGGRPVGYVQLYELGDDAAEFGLADGRGVWSLDLFVGDVALHGSGLGRRVVRLATEHARAGLGAREVVIMPYVENLRAIAAYRAAGFVDEAVVPDHELHEGVLRDGLRMRYRPG